MFARRIVLIVIAVLTATVGTHDVVACGDKFLVPSRGARFELSMAVRQRAAILLYAHPQSALASAVTRLSIDPALQKAGYRPTFVAGAGELEQALRRGGWDVVLADVADGPAVTRAVAMGDTPAVLAVVSETKGVDMSRTKKALHRRAENAETQPVVHRRDRRCVRAAAYGTGQSGEEIAAMRRMAFVVITLVFASVRDAAPQAWVLPARVGAVTFVLQQIDHVGRMTNEGTRHAVGKAMNYAFDVEFDYAFTDRFSISTTMPYILSKYTDPNDPPPFLPFPEVDSCRCWQHEFADFGFTARYNLVNINRQFMVTPAISYGVPSHPYEYVGEAVVGRQLQELRAGVDAGQRFDRIRSLVQARYAYTMVRQVLEVPNNRSNGAVEGAFEVMPRLSARGMMSWQ
jgi:hypothetical protein